MVDACRACGEVMPVPSVLRGALAVIPQEHMAIIGVGLLVCCCGFGFLYLCCRAAAADDQKAAAHAAPRPPPPKWARVDAAKAKKPAAAPHGAAHVRGSAAAPVTPVPRGSATPAPRPVAPPAADNAPATPRTPRPGGGERGGTAL